MNMKGRRQSAILQLVSGRPVRSQDALRRLLAAMDIQATQATISRDVKELGLVKRSADGAYQSARGPAAPAIPDERVRRAVAEYLRRVERVQQLLVLKTDPGQAQPLAFALDHAAWPEIVGTVAGDDTILVVLRTEGSARTVGRRVERWVAGEGPAAQDSGS
jgi:transcriptional regulator of arginine metabolism